MKKNKPFVLIFTSILILISEGVKAQIDTAFYQQQSLSLNIETDSIFEDAPHVKLIAKYKSDKVSLRWAPTSFLLWENCNEHGYTLVRVELDDDFVIINQRIFQIYPWDEEKILSEIDEHDPYALIAGNLLLAPPDTSITTPFMQHQNQNNQLTMALFSADLSKKAASMLGFYYQDTTIEIDKKYFYQVIPNIGDSTYFDYIMSNIVEIDTDKYSPNRPISSIAVLEHENQIQLNWPRNQNGIEYTAYFIERSVDSIHFEQIHELPYTQPMADEEYLRSDAINFIDSVENYVKYYYRVRGIDPFADLTPWSEVVSGMGRDRTPPAQPLITSLTWEQNDTVYVQWEMPELSEDLIGYIIMRTELSTNQSTFLTDTLLPYDQFDYLDPAPDDRYLYGYSVIALDTAGNGAPSLPVTVSKLDLDPPSIPVNLRSEVDSTGLISLHWSPSPEWDTYGYYVYYANAPNREFLRLSPSPDPDTTFQYKVDLNTLTEKIYFRVTSVDFKMNISDFSEIIEVKLPDTIPPLPPIIHDYRAGQGFAELFWYPSTSLDAEKQFLYRRHNDSTEWILIAEMPNSVSYYRDSTVEFGSLYFYDLYCMDDDGLLSREPSSVYISIPQKNEAQNGLQNIRISKKDNKVNISWETAQFRSIKIFRKEESGQLLTYKLLPGDASGFTDEKVSRKKRYSYAFQVFDHRGNRSRVSSEYQIKL
jgi:uncharacterized protein